MSIRCALGWHDPHGVYKQLSKPEQQLILVPMPFGFEVRFFPIVYKSDRQRTHWECSRCGKMFP